MPNRIIKESICTSDDFNNLNWFEQSLFLRLIVAADDYGRMDARSPILLGKMFPLSSVTDKMIADAMSKLTTQDMVKLYTVKGKPYLQLTAWTLHQTPRAKESKYPSPEDSDESLQADANICMQMNANVSDIRYSINDIRYSDTIDDKPRKARFTPPSLEDVEAYVRERNSPVDPKKFYEYFSAGNWKDAKGNQVKNWKQKLLTWEQYSGTKKPEAKKSVSFADLTWEEDFVYDEG